MAAMPSGAQRALERSRILVVEDDWHIASSMKKWLEDEGAHIVGPASTSKIGRLLADIYKPQVAIVDLNLGGTYAYNLISWLNSGGIPVIVVTSYSFAGEVTPNLGAVLSKPVEKSALIEAIRSAQEASGRPDSSSGCEGGQHLH
jgi:CheY-like chemotaxis protein